MIMTQSWKKFLEEKGQQPMKNITGNQIVDNYMFSKTPTGTITAGKERSLLEKGIDFVKDKIAPPESTKWLLKFYNKNVGSIGRPIQWIFNPAISDKDMQDTIKTQAANDAAMNEKFKGFSNTAQHLAQEVLSEEGAKKLPTEYFETADWKAAVFNGSKLETKPIIRKLGSESSFSQLYDTIAYKLAKDKVLLSNEELKQMFPEYNNISDNDLDFFKSSVSKDVQRGVKRDINELAEYYPSIAKLDGYTHKFTGKLKFMNFFANLDATGKISYEDMQWDDKKDIRDKFAKYKSYSQYLVDVYKQAQKVAVWDWDVNIYDVLDNLRDKIPQVNEAMSYIESNDLNDDFILNLASKVRKVAEDKRTPNQIARDYEQMYNNEMWESHRRWLDKNWLIWEKALIRAVNDTFNTNIWEPEIWSSIGKWGTRYLQGIGAGFEKLWYGIEKWSYWVEQVLDANSAWEALEWITNTIGWVSNIIAGALNTTRVGVLLEAWLATDTDTTNNIKEFLGKAGEKIWDNAVALFNKIREWEGRDELSDMDLYHMNRNGEAFVDLALRKALKKWGEGLQKSKGFQKAVKWTSILADTVKQTVKQSVDYLKTEADARGKISNALNGTVEPTTTKQKIKQKIQYTLDDVKDFAQRFDRQFHKNLAINMIKAQMADGIPFETAVNYAVDKIKGYRDWIGLNKKSSTPANIDPSKVIDGDAVKWKAKTDTPKTDTTKTDVETTVHTDTPESKISYDSALTIGNAIEAVGDAYKAFKMKANAIFKKNNPVEWEKTKQEIKEDKQRASDLEEIAKEMELTVKDIQVIQNSPYTQKILDLVDGNTEITKDKKGNVIDVKKVDRLSSAQIQEKFLSDSLESLRESLQELTIFKKDVWSFYDKIPDELMVDPKELFDNYLAPIFEQRFWIIIDWKNKSASFKQWRVPDPVDEAAILWIHRLFNDIKIGSMAGMLLLKNIQRIRSNQARLAYKEWGLKDTYQAMAAEVIRKTINKFLDDTIGYDSAFRSVDRKYEQIMRTIELFDWLFDKDLEIRKQSRSLLMKMPIEELAVLDEFVPWLAQIVAITNNVPTIVNAGIKLRMKTNQSTWNKALIYLTRYSAIGAVWTIAGSLFWPAVWGMLWFASSPYVVKTTDKLKKEKPDLKSFNKYVNSLSITKEKKIQLQQFIKEGMEKSNAKLEDITNWIQKTADAFDEAVELEAKNRIKRAGIKPSSTIIKKETANVVQEMKDIIETTVAPKRTLGYEDMSLDALNELAEYKSIPEAEYKKIEAEVMKRMWTEAMNTETNELDRKFAKMIYDLNSQEQRIGKVGNNEVSAETRHKQSMELQSKKDKIIEQMIESYMPYSTESDIYAFVDEKWTDLENKPIEWIENKKPKSVMYPDEQSRIKELKDERDKASQKEDGKTDEKWTKQPDVSDDKRIEYDISEDPNKMKLKLYKWLRWFTQTSSPWWEWMSFYTNNINRAKSYSKDRNIQEDIIELDTSKVKIIDAKWIKRRTAVDEDWNILPWTSRKWKNNFIDYNNAKAQEEWYDAVIYRWISDTWPYLKGIKLTDADVYADDIVVFSKKSSKNLDTAWWD